MKPLLNDLLLWCLSAPGRLDPSKGLWLWGDIGSGKTTMLHVILRFCRIVRPADAEGNPYGFRISNAIEVCSGYQRKGYDGIQTYIDSRRQAFDELGSETIPTGYYGNTENVFQYILQRRYDRRHTSFTHVTTNLSVDQIAEVYAHASMTVARRCSTSSPCAVPHSARNDKTDNHDKERYTHAHK